MSAQDTEAARRFYTRISPIYDALADHHEHRARELGLQLLDAHPGEHVLEVGFGTGGALVALAQAVGRTGRVAGIDISEGMRDVAAHRLTAAGLNDVVDLHIAAVPPLPLQAQSFDAAFMAFTLELFPDDTIPVLLESLRRTLKPTGRLVVVSMDSGTREHHPGVAERTYQWMHQHFPHIVDCRAIDAAALLRQAGFRIVREEHLAIWGLPVAVLRGAA